MDSATNFHHNTEVQQSPFKYILMILQFHLVIYSINAVVHVKSYTLNRYPADIFPVTVGESGLAPLFLRLCFPLSLEDARCWSVCPCSVWDSHTALGPWWLKTASWRKHQSSDHLKNSDWARQKTTSNPFICFAESHMLIARRLEWSRWHAPLPLWLFDCITKSCAQRTPMEGETAAIEAVPRYSCFCCELYKEDRSSRNHSHYVP